MRTAKVTLLVVLMVMCIGCALTNMTPAERQLTLCEESMGQYEKLHAQSVAIDANKDTKPETRKMLRTEINPKLNQLKPLVISYCEGATDKKYDINKLVTEITTLFMEVK